MVIFKISIFLGCIFVFTEKAFGQAGCTTPYTNTAIYGNDLTQVAGSSSSCCLACQKNSGCVAYTWNSINGGTCWLKSGTAPTYVSNGQFTVIMSPTPARTYSLNISYDSTNFFDLFTFFTANYNEGFTNYVDKATATSSGIAKIQGQKVYLGSDNFTTLAWNNTKGRDTVNLQSLSTFDSGLFILSVDHIPTGPPAAGLWPAFWTYGPNWPNEGEIDILESITYYDHNDISLHTNEGCAFSVNDSIFFNGQWAQQSYGPMTNCTTNPGYGCSITAPNGTYNTGFNQAGGGAYVMEWDSQNFIRIWNFVKPNVPADILNESPNPNPDTWGMPTAFFRFGDNCNGTHHFRNQVITINNAFCGFAGQSWDYPGGECACANHVRFAPYDFSDAYFLVNYIKVFCRPGDPCRVK